LCGTTTVPVADPTSPASVGVGHGRRKGSAGIPGTTGSNVPSPRPSRTPIVVQARKSWTSGKRAGNGGRAEIDDSCVGREREQPAVGLRQVNIVHGKHFGAASRVVSLGEDVQLQLFRISELLDDRERTIGACQAHPERLRLTCADKLETVERLDAEVFGFQTGSGL
jgi:hypothetical protein